MQGFVRHFVIPIARRRKWKDFCEIGASKGVSTDELLKLPINSYTIVDPCFDEDLARKYARDSRVKVLKSNSLDALPNISDTFDCILIDGDHNWYTVFNELRMTRERDLLRQGGMIFFHDVGWPYERRDMYYQPESIPTEYLQKYERKGLVRGQSALVDHGGSYTEVYNAVHEGGPHNGVLTAIEDFVAEYPSDYSFSRVKLGSGLGILQFRRRRLGDDMSFFLLRTKAGIYSLAGTLSGK